MTKILWLYRYIPEYDFDNWLHLKFVETMKQHAGVEVLTYGPGIDKGYPHLTTLPYNPKITINDIKKHFDFDVQIMNTKSRMFTDYNPHKKIANGQWLPSDFDKINTPRIVIEEDYHYETDDLWYQQSKIDLILQRHWSQAQRQVTVPMKWFPFSVDINTFCPGPVNRQNKICFAGSSEAHTYICRRTACNKLNANRLIVAFPNRQKIGIAYVNCLKEYVAHLSCASTYRLTPAKMFEIMASGSILLTNENDDLPLLFPPGSYCTYKTDCSDVIAVARKILMNRQYSREIVKNGLEAVRTRHSHQTRINELLNIINSLRRDTEVKT
jgi:hypothetical protein